MKKHTSNPLIATIKHKKEPVSLGKQVLFVTYYGMDKIIFIDEGKLVAVGTHEELYASCEAYHNMVELQKLEDEKEG